MIENDLDVILTKTIEYYTFIKYRLEKDAVHLTHGDQKVFNAIHSSLVVFTEDIRKGDALKTEARKNILNACIAHLQRLDRITKDYKLFQE